MHSTINTNESTGKDISSPSINSTFIRRTLTIYVYKLLRRICPRQGVVLFVSKNICIKTGAFTHLSEASTLKFIAQHTSIPVPKVHCSFVHHGQTFIVMERLAGNSLALVWNKLPKESRNKILEQLAAYVKQLRTITYNDDIGIANVDGGSLYDGRITGGAPRFGPFKTIQEFHLFLRQGLTRQPGYDLEVDHMMEMQDRPWSQPVFTHGDLSSLNILVHGEEVVGIIDWETSGWYPSYWEYTTACQTNARNIFWREQIDNFLVPLPRELEMDQIRLKWFGDT